MLYLGGIVVLSLLIGLHRRAGVASHLLLVLGVTVIVGAWYLSLTRGA